MSLSLLRTRRFAPFFVTQFLGAFNDNVFKNALVIAIAFQAGKAGGMSPDALVNLAGGLFVLPMFLFSATAGQIAERMEKSRLIRWVKLAEIGVMALAAVGFLVGSVGFLLGVLFLMGAQSAFFGPVKYGILPQALREEELVAGNGLVEMGTFLAILLGTLLGGALAALDTAGPIVLAVVLLVLAVAGYVASRGIPEAPATAPDLRVGYNLFRETLAILRHTRANKTVFNSVLGISWFWFFGATLLAQLQGFTRDWLGGDESVVTLLLTVFALGIGVGSLLCERLSGRLVEIGLVPFGAIGLTVFTFDLYLAAPSVPDALGEGAGAFLSSGANWRVMIDLLLASVFGGFFIVPLYALVQSRSPVELRSRIIAGNNVLNALFMVASAGLAIGALSLGFTVPELFALLAVLNALVAIYIFTLVPEFLMRFLVWMLVRTLYRLRIRGIDAIPDEGPAVVVCNHVSFVDALVIAAACRRPIRFVMDHRIFATPVLSFVFRVGRAIPIAPARDNPEMMERAFDRIAEELEAGEVVGIFPEGRITADGDMNPFRPGIERIVQRTPAPVVPMALRGLFGSFFSRDGGKAMSRPSRLFTRFRSPIELVVADAVPAEAVRADDLGSTVAGLRGDWR